MKFYERILWYVSKRYRKYKWNQLVLEWKALLYEIEHRREED